MPVEKPAKGHRLDRVLVCERCEARSRVYRATSPAAPELSACELAERDGWMFSIGFFAMLAGHEVFCPACSRY